MATQCVRFHPNSLYIATGSSDWSARLWDVQRGTSVRVFIGHQGVVSTLAFSPDGRYLATAGESISLPRGTHTQQVVIRRGSGRQSLGPWLWTSSEKDDGSYGFHLFTRIQCRVERACEWWGRLDCQVLGCQECGGTTRENSHERRH